MVCRFENYRRCFLCGDIVDISKEHIRADISIGENHGTGYLHIKCGDKLQANKVEIDQNQLCLPLAVNNDHEQDGA